MKFQAVSVSTSGLNFTSFHFAGFLENWKLKAECCAGNIGSDTNVAKTSVSNCFYQVTIIALFVKQIVLYLQIEYLCVLA